MHEHTNALIHEKSPYLLQHAHNPVDWHAWNDETLAKARAEDKPIFLSIGYSTCHWCHVMEHESFEDPRVAAVMNRYFINIKVDREERPDVDQTYMAAVHAMNQQGGWPLSAWLTPDLKPFYTGTYFPPTSRFGRPGFVDILERIHELWQENRSGLQQQANQVAAAIEEGARSAIAPADLDESMLHYGYGTLLRMYDPDHGGFGGAPKFPRPVTLTFLLRYYHRTGNEDALTMVVQTLRAMATGGIHDHLGGGFSRYSVDPVWRVPHFEKMLYDQAQLMWAYAQTYQITGLDEMAATVRDIAGYVARDLTDEQGGFFSAEDADSTDEDGASREGAFYAWNMEQLDELLGADRARVVAAYYGMTAEGNFEHGRNVLHVSNTLNGVADEMQLEPEATRAILQDSLAVLYRERLRRPRPHRDDKILTSWNGLMISALSHAYRALGDAAFLTSAARAADFVLTTMYRPDTRTLMRRYRDGETAVPGFLDDHAYFALGLLDVYEAGLEPKYLSAAADIAGVMLERFWDERDGGFFFTVEESPAGMARRKDDYDGAEPAGNSIAALVLLRLAEMTGDGMWLDRAEATIRAVSGQLSTYPETLPAMLGALDMLLSAPQQVVVAGGRDEADTQAMLRAIQSLYLPNTTLLHASGDATLGTLAPWVAEMRAVEGRATAYLCRNFACEAPTTDADALVASLGARKPARG